MGKGFPPPSLLFSKNFAAILLSVGFLCPVECVWRQLGRHTDTCAYPIVQILKTPTLSHTKRTPSSHSRTITHHRINGHLEKNIFWRACMDSDQPLLPQKTHPINEKPKPTPCQGKITFKRRQHTYKRRRQEDAQKGGSQN